MKALVCGSRSLDSEENGTRVHLILTGYQARYDDFSIIHGAAAFGADRWAAEWARENRAPCASFPADWELYGRRAGILRNLQMLDEKPDLVIAFWDGKSKGTQHTIEEARRRQIPVEVITS